MTQPALTHYKQLVMRYSFKQVLDLGQASRTRIILRQAQPSVSTAKEAWNTDLVMKVKEPKKAEYDCFREGQIYIYVLSPCTGS